MTMTNLYADSHGSGQFLDGNEVDVSGSQSLGVKLFPAPNHNLACVALDLNHVQGSAGGDSESLTLAHSEVVNAVVGADHVTRRGDQFSSGIGQGFVLLVEIRVQKTLLISAGNKTDFLRIGLLGQSETMPAR